MNNRKVDVTMHIDETIDTRTRNSLCNSLMQTHGVMSADCQTQRPHLMIIKYDPDEVAAIDFLDIVRRQGLHAELIGM
jgi:hypothetical protein